MGTGDRRQVPTSPRLVEISGGRQNRDSTVETPRGLRRGPTHFFLNGGWGQEGSKPNSARQNGQVKWEDFPFPADTVACK